MRTILAAAMSTLLLLPSFASADDVLCAPGTVSESGFEPCTACPPGTFASGFGESECLPCLPGRFAAGVANTACTPCPPGSYASLSAASACTPCAPGSASGGSGAAACALCDYGFAQPASGQTACVACAPGSHAPAPATTTCLPCPRNSHAPEGGARTCLDCGCDDSTVCTRDSCDAISGACEAPPVAGCAVGTMHFAGTVTEVDPDLLACFAPGDPVTGSWQFDPEAPDDHGADPSRATFAITSFELRVGAAGAERIAVANPHAGLSVTDDFDAVEVGAAPPLVVTPTACGEPEEVFLQLYDGSSATLASDALPVDAAALNAFPARAAILGFAAFPAPIRVESRDLVFSPEPGAGAGWTAAATLLALRARSRSERRRGRVEERRSSARGSPGLRESEFACLGSPGCGLGAEPAVGIRCTPVTGAPFL